MYIYIYLYIISIKIILLNIIHGAKIRLSEENREHENSVKFTNHVKK